MDEEQEKGQEHDQTQKLEQEHEKEQEVEDKMEDEEPMPEVGTVDDSRERDKIWMRTYNLTEEQLAECKECFSMFDRTGTGLVLAPDVGTALRAMGQNPSEAEVQEILQDAQLDDTGMMNLDEYMRIVGSRGLKTEPEMEEELEEALRTFDKNGEGCIDAEELRNVMKTLGETLEDDDIHDMLKVAEVAGDGKINYIEFMRKLTAK